MRVEKIEWTELRVYKGLYYTRGWVAKTKQKKVEIDTERLGSIFPPDPLRDIGTRITCKRGSRLQTPSHSPPAQCRRAAHTRRGSSA